MTPYYENDGVTLYLGDCIEVMQTLPDNSVHAVVTDPPYGLGFAGRAWDALPPGPDFAAEALRVLKPGGYLLAFGGTRTWHRLAVAIEDAGFEIRDSIAWLYSSGYPKGTNLAKVITAYGRGYTPEAKGVSRATREDGGTLELSPGGAEWKGWSTALKPAFEPILVARKQIESSLAHNVLTHRAGGINIGSARIPTSDTLGREFKTIRSLSRGIYGLGGCVTMQELEAIAERGGKTPHGENAQRVLDRLHEKIGWKTETHEGGRYPSNVTLDESAAALLGEDAKFFPAFRFESKASQAERPATGDLGAVQHPTVKPLDLMRWLVRLVTPPNGTVLEPFAGSGTTLEAALIEGFNVVGIEREADYLPLIMQRITKPLQQSLFGEGIA